MKKMMMTLAAVLCCAMTTTVFTACGSDSDDNTNTNNNTNPNQPKIVGYQVDYNLELPLEEQQEVYLCGNYYLLCDKIEVGYIDENGQEQREVVNNGKWSKSVVYKKSLNGYLKLYLTKPTGLSEESLTYDYYAGLYNLGSTYQSIKAILSDGTKKDPAFDSFTYNPINASSSFPKTTILRYMEEKMKTEVGILTITFNI